MSAVLAHVDAPAAVDRGQKKRALFLLDRWSSFEQQQPMAQALGAAGWECWFMPLRGSDLGNSRTRIARLWPLAIESTKTLDQPASSDLARPPGRLRVLATRLLRAPGMSILRECLLALQMARDWSRHRAAARRV